MLSTDKIYMWACGMRLECNRPIETNRNAWLIQITQFWIPTLLGDKSGVQFLLRLHRNWIYRLDLRQWGDPSLCKLKFLGKSAHLNGRFPLSKRMTMKKTMTLMWFQGEYKCALWTQASQLSLPGVTQWDPNNFADADADAKCHV